jgi:hypothetical protein
LLEFGFGAGRRGVSARGFAESGKLKMKMVREMVEERFVAAVADQVEGARFKRWGMRVL